MKRSLKKLIAVILLIMICISGEIYPATKTEAAKAKKGRMADFVFVIDSTGSMEPYIASVQRNLTEFVEQLSEQKIDLRMAVIDYKDVISDGADSTKTFIFGDSCWTSSADEAINVFHSISVSGGGDTPETPTNAIKEVFDLKTDDEWENDNHSEFVFLLSDAGYKDGESGDSTITSMDYDVDVLRSLNIKTTVVSKNDYKDDYDKLYTLTGGEFIDIDSVDYFKLMQEVAEWVVEGVIDSDGDGLPDDWETDGVTVNGTFVDLPRMGADPEVPDIFVEVDWMENPGREVTTLFGKKKIVDKKSCVLPDSAFREVYNAFKSAGLSTKQGINIHIDAGPDSVLNYDTGETWGDLSGANSVGYQDVFELGQYYENWNDLAMKNFTPERWTIFRYCVLVNKYHYYNASFNNSSGIAENIPGQFFIVASGCISDNDVAKAGTFMHELGHTLGLSHGDICYGEDTGQIENSHDNYKPNHISIMNYTYQFSGIYSLLGGSLANYQPFDLPAINEEHIDENQGIDPDGASSGFDYAIKVPKWFGLFKSKVEVSRKPIDFNANFFTESDLSYDLNPASENGKTILTQTLNEWTHLQYDGALIGGNGDSLDDEVDISSIHTLISKTENTEDVHELSIEEALQNGVLGWPGCCSLNLPDDPFLYAEIEDQTLDVQVENLYFETSTPKLQVVSDALGIHYEEQLEIEGSEDTISFIEVHIPANKLKVGEYELTYILTLEDGQAIEQTGKVSVIEPERGEMIVGTSEKLTDAEDLLAWESSDSSIIDIDGNTANAKKAGTVVLTASTPENDKIVYIVTAVDNKSLNENDDDLEMDNRPKYHATSRQKSDSGMILVIIIAVIIVIVAIIVITIVVVLNNGSGKMNVNGQKINSLPHNPKNYGNGLNAVRQANIKNGIRFLNGSRQGQMVELPAGTAINIGKDARISQIIVDGGFKNVSRLHCTIEYSAQYDKYFVTDCSLNGTYMDNGTRFQKSVQTPVDHATVIYLADRSCRIMLL